MKELFDILFAADLFTEEEHRLLLKALASRGKNKGDLRAKLPKGDDARGAWRSVMSYCSIRRASLFGLMIASPEEVEAFDTCEVAIKRVFGSPAVARITFAALQPLRFNTVGDWFSDRTPADLADIIIGAHAKKQEAPSGWGEVYS